MAKMFWDVPEHKRFSRPFQTYQGSKIHRKAPTEVSENVPSLVMIWFWYES